MIDAAARPRPTPTSRRGSTCAAVVLRTSRPGPSSRSARAGRDRSGVLLLAELDGERRGQRARATAPISPTAFAVSPRVLPAFAAARRRHGAAAELAGARASGSARRSSRRRVDDDGSLAFAERFGFAEIDRAGRAGEARSAASRRAAPPDGVRARHASPSGPSSCEAAYPLALRGLRRLRDRDAGGDLARGLAARGGDAARRLVRRARRRRDRRLLGPDGARQRRRRRGRAHRRAPRLARAAASRSR